MIFLWFIAGFLAVSLIGWIIHALTHPVLAGRGALIFLCKAAGVIALISGAGTWLGQGLLQALPGLLFTAGFFFAANRLESRWPSW